MSPMLPALTPALIQSLLLLGCICAGLCVALLTRRLRIPWRTRRTTSHLSAYLDSYRRAEVETDAAARRHISIDPEVIVLSTLGIASSRIRLIHIRLLGSLVPALGFLLGRFPLLPACMVGLLGYVVVDAWLKGRWQKFRTGMEEELPVFVSRLGAMMLLNESLTACLAEVLDTLDPNTSKLRLWMQVYLQGLRQEGMEFLDHARVQANRISPSLALVVFQMGRVVETGGAGFARAFAGSAQDLQMILEVRAVAAAKADGARSAIALLLVIMGVVIGLMATSPAMRAGYVDATAQMILMAALGTMALGHYILNGMITDALE